MELLSREDLLLSVSGFRTAIDNAGPELWERAHIEFPRGACGHASEMLGKHLIHEHQIRPYYVCCYFMEWDGYHAWLEWDGLIIDITGDQFELPPVIVEKESAFHSMGRQEMRHPVCLEHQVDWWAEHCEPLWKEILPHLPDPEER